MHFVEDADFVDFALASGRAKLALVKQSREQPRTSYVRQFYAPLVAAIVAHHAGDAQALSALLAATDDLRKQRVYPPLVEAWKAYVATWSGPFTVRAGPRSTVRLGDVEVRVAPHLEVELDGTPHPVALHFRLEPLAGRRIDMTVAVMRAAFYPKVSGIGVRDGERLSFGVLDVPRSKLHVRTGPGGAVDGPLLTVLGAEAVAFAHLAEQLLAAPPAPAV
jgi:hypothetical protein